MTRPSRLRLPGIGSPVESPEDFRGSRLLEFDGCNESEDVVPVIFDDLSVDIARRGDFDLCAIPDPSALEGVKPLAFEVVDPGCIREPQQMHGPKNHLTIPVSVGGMDVAFHYIVVHKAEAPGVPGCFGRKCCNFAVTP